MIHLPWLEHGSAFPDPSQALEDPNGLLCAGGDLSAPRLRLAYQNGIFPWFGEDEPILWWSPDPRMVLEPKQFHASRSLRKDYRRRKLQFTLNHAFADVMRACAQPRNGESGTWITPRMLHAYQQLHARGDAASVEVWEDDLLIGGVYGVHIGGMFFAESMFSVRTNGSKFALWMLSATLKARQFALIDCQMPTEHLSSLGARPVPRQQYLKITRTAVRESKDLEQLASMEELHKW